MPRDPEPRLLDLGDTGATRAFNVRAPICELMPQNTEVEGPHLVPGPHLEPLDAEAEAAMKRYWRDNPGVSLDPTRNLPLQGGFDAVVQGQLNRLLAETGAKPQVDEVSALRAELAELRAVIARLTPAASAAPVGKRAAAS